MLNISVPGQTQWIAVGQCENEVGWGWHCCALSFVIVVQQDTMEPSVQVLFRRAR